MVQEHQLSMALAHAVAREMSVTADGMSGSVSARCGSVPDTFMQEVPLMSNGHDPQ